MKFNTRPVLTLDIVDFSEMSTDAQIAAIRLLIQWLHEAIPPEHNNELSRLWSPAGDGGSITFLTDIKPSWKTAIALNQLVKEHNQKHPSTQPIQLRLGLHSGSVVEEKDFDNRVNVWGPGINTSARVASLAKPGQIVASKKYVEEADLARRHEDVVPIGKWWTKHYKSIELYNINIEGAGIRPEEVDIWYGPFHYPLQQAIETYEAMLDELLDARERGFRIAVVAKRLLDIDPRNRAAKLVLEALSKKTVARPSELKGKDLHDDFLSPLSPAALNYFFSNAKFRSFRKDENVVKEGDIADSMMMVVSGKVGLFFKVRGGSSQDLSPGNENQDTGVTLEEGEIIGEMGLFSPGNKRTATVKALRNSIMLTLDYNLLAMEPRYLEMDYETLSGITLPDPRVRSSAEIRKNIWESYCRRMIPNQINSSPLFQRLNSSEVNRLAMEGEFLPNKFGKPVELTAEDAWRYWIIVVSNSITVYARDDQPIIYRRGECIGSIRLLMSGLPFRRFEIAPGTQLVRFKWSLIKELISESEDFRKDCLLSAGEEHLRYFGIA